jgi:hypothetical protein
VADPRGKRAFLIMPFSDDLDWLHRAIVDAGTVEGVDVRRADSIFSPGVILEQIFEAIDEADAVIAVCTDRNANVFFELGYAWRDHRPILLAEDATDLPFDVAHYRTEIYGPDGDSRRASLAVRLRAAIRAAVEEERLPKGRRLSSSRAVEGHAEINGTLVSHGRDYRLTLVNSGSMDLHGVDVSVPEEVQSFHIVTHDLPIATFRPGERVGLPVARSMGGGPGIFDITVTATTPTGELYSRPIKIS